MKPHLPVSGKVFAGVYTFYPPCEHLCLYRRMRPLGGYTNRMPLHNPLEQRSVPDLNPMDSRLLLFIEIKAQQVARIKSKVIEIV